MGCNTNKSPDRNINHCNRYNPSVAGGGTNSNLNMGGDLSGVNQGVPYTFAKYNPVGRDTSQEEEPNVPLKEPSLATVIASVPLVCCSLFTLRILAIILS